MKPVFPCTPTLKFDYKVTILISCAQFMGINNDKSREDLLPYSMLIELNSERIPRCLRRG